jgi:hypothetical protein
MMKARTGTCATLIAVAAAFLPAGAAAQTSADGLIAWTAEHNCDNDGGFGLANYITQEVLETPGFTYTHTDRCTRDDASQWSLSRDGRFLAFTSDDNLLLYDRVNEGMVLLPFNTFGFRESEPSLTGTGSFVAYSTNQAGKGNIKLFDRSTNANIPLPGLNTKGFTEKQPSVSGGAGFIAFASNRNGDWDIFLYDRTRHRLVALPKINRKGLDDSEPSISGDGNLIAFTAEKKGGRVSFIRLYNRATQSFVPMPGIHDFVVDDDQPPCDIKPFVDCWRDVEPSLNGAGALIAFVSDRCDFERPLTRPCVYLYDRGISTLTKLSFLGSEVFDAAIR